MKTKRQRNRLTSLLPLLLVLVFGAGMLFHEEVQDKPKYDVTIKALNNPKVDQPYILKQPSSKYKIKLLPTNRSREPRVTVYEG